jgi:hypothetical protein
MTFVNGELQARFMTRVRGLGHADLRGGEPAWRDPFTNQAGNGREPHTQVVSAIERIWVSIAVAVATSHTQLQ